MYTKVGDPITTGPGNVRYSLRFTEGELCSADGVGFILSSDLPCTRSLFLAQEFGVETLEMSFCVLGMHHRFHDLQ